MWWVNDVNDKTSCPYRGGRAPKPSEGALGLIIADLVKRNILTKKPPYLNNVPDTINTIAMSPSP